MSAQSRLTYRMPEVAELLGVGESTVQRWCASGALPCVRPPGGGVVLVLPADLQKFLETHRDGLDVKPKRRLSSA